MVKKPNNNNKNKNKNKTKSNPKKVKKNQKGGDQGCSVNMRTGRCSKRGTRLANRCTLSNNGRCKYKPVERNNECAVNRRTGRCSKTGTRTPELCTLSANGRCKKVTGTGRGRGRPSGRGRASGRSTGRGRASGRSTGRGRGRGRGRARAVGTKLSDALSKNCRNYIMFDDENIRNYLAEDRMNFVTKLNGNYECQNLQNLKTQHKYFGNQYKTWYECRRANNMFGPNNVNRRSKFVKIGSGLTVVKAPRWWPNGARPSGSRVYKLVKDKKVKALVSSNVLAGDNIVSADHCNHRSDVQTYKMVEIK